MGRQTSSGREWKIDGQRANGAIDLSHSPVGSIRRRLADVVASQRNIVICAENHDPSRGIGESGVPTIRRRLDYGSGLSKDARIHGQIADHVDTAAKALNAHRTIVQEWSTAEENVCYMNGGIRQGREELAAIT